jgi:hypothetical protein
VIGPAHVAGVGLWSPGFADARRWLAGAPDPAAVAPACTLVSPRHLRFTSLLTQMGAAVFEQAVAGAGVELSALDAVFASSQGEIRTAVELIGRIADEGTNSPARFMNSVHNTLTGHLSIACRSHGVFTALAAGEDTVAAAFVEALAMLADGDRGAVAVIVGDEALPPPIDVDRYGSLAAAFLLRREPAAGTLATITGIRRDASVPAFAAAASLAGNPCAPSLGVVEAVLRRRGGPVRLDGAAGAGWCLELEPAGATT